MSPPSGTRLERRSFWRNDLKGQNLPTVLACAASAFREIATILEPLRAALAADPPSLLRDGGVIASGYDADLDDARTLRDEGRSVIGRDAIGFAGPDRYFCSENQAQQRAGLLCGNAGQTRGQDAGPTVQRALYPPPDHGKRDPVHNRRLVNAGDPDIERGRTRA